MGFATNAIRASSLGLTQGCAYLYEKLVCLHFAVLKEANNRESEIKQFSKIRKETLIKVE